MAKVGYQLATHHLLIVETIDKLISGELGKKKAMVLTPPGSAKSTYTSKLLPAWFCNPEMFPRDLILACSYSYNLVEGFGRDARDILQEESKVLGLQISPTAKASGDWRTTNNGGYFCAGVGSGIAGHRAKLGLIDDYIPSEESITDELLEKIWNWYWNDFWPRLIPNQSWQFIIANRRHKKDLVGRLLEKEGDEWHVIKLPYFAREDDPLGRPSAPLSVEEGKELSPEELKSVEDKIIATRLWPEWYSEEHARNVLHLPDKAKSAGLWQQEPVAEGGNYFRSDDLVEYKAEDLPKDLRIYAGSDWSLRKKEVNDRTCHIFGGVDSTGRLWILPDWFWKHCDTLEATLAMFEMEKRRQPVVWWHGRENITGSIAPFVYLMMRERNIYVPIEELSESKDKEAKAQPIRARTMAKMVMFPGFAPGWDKAKEELLAFPNGDNDDFVDGLAKLGQGLAKMTPASITPPVQTLEQILNPRLTCKWIERSHRRKELALRPSNY